MTVKTKAYTINRLISEIQGLNSAAFASFGTFTTALSPVLGVDSVKVAVLDNFLNGDLENLFYGDATASARPTVSK